ncbi:MAG: ASPIC/UnbV domain-containing protein [Segetibacter sp.]
MADFDNDGWKDLFISNGIFKDITNLDFVKYTSGYSQQYIKSTANNAETWKLIQQMPATKLSNYLFRNNHDLSFTNVTKEWGLTKSSVSNGSAYADLDNDGDLDLIINNLDDEATLYKNNTSTNNNTNYIKVRLKGEGKNTYGIGAKIYVKTAHIDQMQEEYVTRGFQSSVDPVMHFGLGTDSVIQSLKVKWPGGKISLLHEIKADTLLIIDESNAAVDNVNESNVAYKSNTTQTALFKDVTASAGINFIHKSQEFIDFKISPLLPYQLSKIGPCLAKADVNGDGLEDVFIGTSAGQQNVLYLQTKDGKFILSASQRG